MLKIAVIGAGTVGSSVINILQANKELILARAGVSIEPVLAVVKNLDKKRELNIKLSANFDDALNDPSIDLIVELIGGIDEAYTLIKKALVKGKAVVSANKALLAYHRYELQDLAKDTPFEYEAAVAGGIPIINALREGLSANHILNIKGILNGTCNFMLTKMLDEGIKYNEILQTAKDLGYAESDPSFDVGGFDAAHKLLILGSIAYGIDAKPEDILIEGIENIRLADIEFAKEFNYSIKLLAIAKRKGDQVELRVHPALINKDEILAKVDGVMNAISVTGDICGETMYYGAGAGGDATASAVIANIIDIARKGKGSPMLGFNKPMHKLLSLMPRDEIETKYYLRLEVEDKAGTLAKIAQILGENKISIEKILQKPIANSKAQISLSTYTCIEKNIKKALKDLKLHSSLKASALMIRIES